MSQVISHIARRAGRQAPPRPESRRPRLALRRLLVVAASSLTAVASLAAGPSTAYASPATGAPATTPVTQAPVRHSGDHLTVTVRDAGKGRDGTFELYCHPGGGSHPDPEGACATVERNTRWGQDVFAPAARGGACTMQYGGPATARVTGTWAGRPVDATYDRRDGCAISRWDRMVPLLPDLGSTASS
ncbi:SSI family serine proteinase inhibitor [Streptomyces cyaneogriseus]|uniref:SSI family serine proteinase inhibitor n=1 Tax=Streptomyces cyaneogriseus TaxID=68192 RepID=UPI00099D0AF2|nr:SSI family serine proteinase inhibitor [Streptomyces cyaneogriseus]